MLLVTFVISASAIIETSEASFSIIINSFPTGRTGSGRWGGGDRYLAFFYYFRAMPFCWA